MIPYARHLIEADDKEAILRVLESDRLTQGEVVPQFEAALCELSGAKYAVAVSSGTAALWCAFATLTNRRGVSALTIPTVTFVATANAARCAGHRLIVRYVDPLTEAPVLDVGVTIGGHPARGFLVVDAAHGPYTMGVEQMRCLSFHPAKHITTGEGGAVLTNDALVAETCRRLRDNGRDMPDPTPCIAGLNLRMSDIHAALGLSQSKKYHRWLARRREIARYYRDRMPEGVVMQSDHEDHAYHLFILWLDPEERWNRDGVRAKLAERGVGSTLWPGHGPLYRLPMYKQDPARFPNAERYWSGHLCIPMFHGLTDGEVEHVATSVREVLA